MMVVMSVMTNCAILGFGSEQLMQWLPWMFSRQESDGDQALALGSGRWVWLLLKALLFTNGNCRGFL